MLSNARLSFVIIVIVISGKDESNVLLFLLEAIIELLFLHLTKFRLVFITYGYFSITGINSIPPSILILGGVQLQFSSRFALNFHSFWPHFQLNCLQVFLLKNHFNYQNQQYTKELVLPLQLISQYKQEFILFILSLREYFIYLYGHLFLDLLCHSEVRSVVLISLCYFLLGLRVIVVLIFMCLYDSMKIIII